MTAAKSAVWKPALVAALVATGVAIAGGLITEIGPWYYALKKPSWQPPDWLFGPVWTLIFGLTAAAATYAWIRARDAADRRLIVVLMLANGALNVLWSLLFFKLHHPDWAIFEVIALWLSVLAPIVAFWPYAMRASLLLVPYLVWVTFAGYLNLTIVRLNGPF